jgi:hypothetical protein
MRRSPRRGDAQAPSGPGAVGRIEAVAGPEAWKVELGRTVRFYRAPDRATVAAAFKIPLEDSRLLVST